MLHQTVVHSMSAIWRQKGKTVNFMKNLHSSDFAEIEMKYHENTNHLSKHLSKFFLIIMNCMCIVVGRETGKRHRQTGKTQCSLLMYRHPRQADMSWKISLNLKYKNIRNF